MENQRNNLLPETNEASPQMYYDDLKYPLTRRGIPIPTAMEDYIHSLTARDTLRDEDIEAIRQQMLAIFKRNGQDVPFDFEDKFKTWFPRDTGEDPTTDTDRGAAENASDGGFPSVNTPPTDQNNTPERESSDTDPVQSSVNPVQSSVDPVQRSNAETSGSRAPQPEIPRNQPLYLHPDLSAKEKVCEYLMQINGEHMASTGEIREALGLAKSTFKWVRDQLIDEGKIEQIGYGLYQLRRSV